MTGTSDDDPLDLTAVDADERAIEALRAGRPPHDPELALDLMYALRLDVERDLPVDRPVPHGTTVIAFATPRPERRLARNGTAVVALTAGLLSLGGVAAASTLAPAGSPLHGLGQALRSAGEAVVGVVAPPETPGRPVATPSTTTSTAAQAPAKTVVVAPRTPPPGASVSVAARSLAAARQVDRLLAEADALLDDGRTTAAVSRLDLAERTLTEVLAPDRADLPERLAALRAQAVPTEAKPARKTKPARSEPADQPGTAEKAKPPAQRTEPADAPHTSAPKGTTVPEPAQLSRDASMKPRA